MNLGSIMRSLKTLSLKALAAAGILTALSGAASAQGGMLGFMGSGSQWAVNGQCGVPRSSYSLELSESYMIWRNGVGSLDVETIVSNDAYVARTVTQSSTGQPRGQAWTYSRVGARISVQPAGKAGFILVRCG